MLPGPTNVPNRVINAMLTPMINHRSDDFRKLYKDIVSKTQKVFETENDIVGTYNIRYRGRRNFCCKSNKKG